jgi:8-amino-7-oxononanoate synthase
VAKELSVLLGCEAAVVTRSSLHAFWDFFGSLSGAESMVYFDSDVYASARWGIERAAARGVPVRSFRHLSAESFLASVAATPRGVRPIVVTDGFCPACGMPAPLGVYQRAALERGGTVVVDDTQALGVLGGGPSRSAPYGRGGSGTIRHLGLRASGFVVVASLAKGFGAPLCVVASDARRITAHARKSETTVHSSPPSAADLRAARGALEVNRASGDRLRARLCDRVAALRSELGADGCASRGAFPIQSVRAGAERPRDLHARLLRAGVRAVLHAPHSGGPPRVSLIVTAAHERGDVRRAARSIRAGSRRPERASAGAPIS